MIKQGNLGWESDTLTHIRGNQGEALRGILTDGTPGRNRADQFQVVLTPAKEGGQAPAHGVHPRGRHDAQRLPARHHAQRGQGPGDHHVAVHGDHHQRHHAADAEERSAEGVQLTTCSGGTDGEQTCLEGAAAGANR